MRFNGCHNSFSSDDEVPLKFSANHVSDPNNSYASLCRRVKVDCEFCEQSFNSRYQSFIHNATHIIIPLLNQTVLKCKQCHFCFTSSADLQCHISKAHPTSIQEEQKKRVKMRNLIQFEDDDLITLPDLLTDLTNNCSVPLNRSIGEEIEEDRFIKEFDVSLEERIKKSQNKQVFGKPTYFDRISHNGFVNGFCDDALNGDSSVHHEELRRPVPVRCKYCKQMFKDRYDLAVHQVSHMRINHRREHLPVSKIKPDVHTSSGTPALLSSDTLLQVCDLCIEFLKPKSHVKYTRNGTLCIPGKRSICSMCSRNFFELTLVTRTKWHKRRQKNKRKTLTNDQRLKNIRHRLKAANKALKR